MPYPTTGELYQLVGLDEGSTSCRECQLQVHSVMHAICGSCTIARSQVWNIAGVSELRGIEESQGEALDVQQYVRSLWDGVKACDTLK